MIRTESAFAVAAPSYSAARARWRVMVGLDGPTTAPKQPEMIGSTSTDTTDIQPTVASPSRVTVG